METANYLYVPAGAITNDNEIRFSLSGYRVISDELRSGKDELESLRLQVNQLAASNSELTREMTGIMTARDHATKQALAANEQVQRVSDQMQIEAEKLTDARTEIARLEKALRTGEPVTIPVPVPDPKPVPNPAGFQPVISKTQFDNLIIGCIVKIDDAGTEDDMVRQSIDKAVEVGCNSVTFWMHPTEVEKHLENIDDPQQNTFRYAADRNVVIGADTIDAALRILPETVNDEEFDAYVDGLITLGAKYLLWNDVDGLDQGERVYTPDEIESGMKRIRRALRNHPNIPVIASLTAGADLDDYRRLYGFEFVEIQTDGTIAELRNFMLLDADVFALFAEQDKSLNYLKDSRAIVVNSDAKAIRLYAIYDGSTDLRKPKLAPKVAEITETNRQFRATRTKVTA